MTRDIPSRKSAKATEGNHDVSVVLANPLSQSKCLGGGGTNTGHIVSVSHGLIDPCVDLIGEFDALFATSLKLNCHFREGIVWPGQLRWLAITIVVYVLCRQILW